MKQSVVDVESHLKLKLYCCVINNYIYCVIMRDKKHLVDHSNKLVEKAKLKTMFRTQRKPVEAGAHGTLNYTIKKGVNKNKIADEKILKSKK